MDGLAMPDLMVADIVEASIAALLANGTLLDRMLESRPGAERDMVRTALQKRPGKVRLGWGGLPPEDWSVVITMHAEPLKPTLGDVVGHGREVPAAATTLAADLGADDGATVSLTGGIPAGIRLPQGRVRLSTDEVAIYQVDAGVMRLVKRGICDTEPLPHLAGDPVVFTELEVLLGGAQAVSVRVDVLSANSLFTVYLAYLLAAFLQAQQNAFEPWMTAQQVSLTDLAPRPQAYPAEFACRTILLPVQTVMAVPEDIGLLTDAVVELATTGVDPHGIAQLQ